MTRAATTGELREARRMWACRLVHLFGCDLSALNAQLTQPPDPVRDFELRKWPIPGTLNWAPATFERILKLGKDPDILAFIEPNVPGKPRYNLYSRVSTHIPESADWLFKPLAPYFNRHLPEVDYATLLIDNCLRRCRKHRLQPDAVEFARHFRPDQVEDIGRSVLSALSENPDPIHLVLLLALYHERQWHQPNSPEAREIEEAFSVASQRFVLREEFTSSEILRSSSKNISRFFQTLRDRIRRQGHQSAQPRNENWVAMKVPNLIIVDAFEGVKDLDLWVGLGEVIPFWAFQYERPTKEEAFAGLDRLFAVASTTSTQWTGYEAESPEAHRRSLDLYDKERRRLAGPHSLRSLRPRTSDEVIHSVCTPPEGINLEKLAAGSQAFTSE